MNTHPEHHQPPEHLPRARIARNWKTHLIWLVPLAAAGFAGWLVYRTLIATDPTLHILFSDTKGLQPGNAQVKYRGAVVGNVESMHLTPDQANVDVEVSLDKSAASLDRAGSWFWIVRPEVSLGQVQALGTLVSGAYIAVRPGPGKEQTHFHGLGEAPLLMPEQKGLKLVLLSDKANSLQRGSPVTYRGIKVGEVLEYRLGPESQVVEITAHIDEGYVPLVRKNSVFWNAGGINFDLGLFGADFRAQSLKALVVGGIAFATPDEAGEAATPEMAFRLHEKPENKWLSWEPVIKLPKR